MTILEGYIAQWRNYPEDEVKVRVARPSILGPSKKLLKDYKENDLSWAEYTTRYVAEIMASPRALKQIDDIIELSKTKTVRLICYEKNPPCHRFILLDMIAEIAEESEICERRISNEKTG